MHIFWFCKRHDLEQGLANWLVGKIQPTNMFRTARELSSQACILIMVVVT